VNPGYRTFHAQSWRKDEPWRFGIASHICVQNTPNFLN